MPNPIMENQQNRGLIFFQIADAWFEISEHPGSRTLDSGPWIQEPRSKTLELTFQIADALFECFWRHVKEQIRGLNKSQAAEAWFELI